MFSHALTVLLVSAFVTAESDYVTSSKGTLCLLITAGHGGNEKPSKFPERSIDTNAATSKKYCGKLISGSCVYDHQYDAADACTSDCKVSFYKDSYTKEIAVGIADKIESLLDMRPYLITLDLKRNKLDVNREINEATFGNSSAIDVYNEYAAAIAVAKNAIGSTGLMIDVHGQSHSHKMQELGYTVSKTKLNCAGTCFLANDTTVHGLVGRSAAGLEAIIRGNKSLGYYLSNQGYNVIPSPANPSPGSNSYYTGGYTVKTYGSKQCGTFDSIQMEIARNERFVTSARTEFIDKAAAAIVQFLQEHYCQCLSKE